MTIVWTAGSRPQSSEESKSNNPIKMDYWLIGAVTILVAMGLVMVASASLHINASNSWYYFNRQLFFVVIGGLSGYVVFHLELDFWRRNGIFLFLFGLVLLVVVLIPGVGKEINGSTRWISLVVFNIQPSELMKLFVVIYVAGYLCRHAQEVCKSCVGFLRPIALIILTGILLICEPDFGSFVVVLTTVLCMMFLAGAQLKQYIAFILIAMIALALLVYIEPYRFERLLAFLNPQESANKGGYQLLQSLIALSRGELFGVGLGNSVQKLFYLPEAHTDFLLAVIGEELGLIGVYTVILCYLIILFRSFQIGWRAELLENRFFAYIAYGLGILLTIEAFINIGVNMGVLPTKGLALPFMSYGGSSLIVSCVMIAIILRIHHEVMSVKKPKSKRSRRWAPVL
ncbi:MAG: putative lipid II flippase FtsW [Methylococcales bacterium]|jgi:cell division protein FtsW|nr:putative lipid II flippase FtsW [Methylococcales bacterium]MBT7408569.1 putative lipid II flippase FtsW [Methylococcales bacterium]